MHAAILVASCLAVLLVVGFLSANCLRMSTKADEFRQITLALTKLIRKAIISGSNGRMVTLSRTMDILGGVFSGSGIEKKANDIKSITKIREKLEHLLTIDKAK